MLTSGAVEHNSITEDKIFDTTKLKAQADDNLNLPSVNQLILERFENIVGKGENAGKRHLLLFPQFFRKLLCRGLYKDDI